ncbi:hypothetical protein MAR_004052, partial [Mya arenaria]
FTVALYLVPQLINHSGDVPPNPGPLSESSDQTSTLSYSALINTGLGIMCLNIQSLKPELHLLEINAQPYDILIQDRVDGGVTIYLRDGLNYRKRPDLSVFGVECVWIPLNTYTDPHNSNNNHWSLLKEGTDKRFSERVDNVIVTCDFNVNILKSPTNKMSNLIASYNTEQLVSSPTHYTKKY